MRDLRSLWVLTLFCVPCPSQGAASRPTTLPRERLDVGLTDGEATHPIFVRMTDQLFATGAEYERYCREHAHEPRRGARGKVIADLEERARKARTSLTVPLHALEAEGALRDVTWFWIVNGFAAEATPAACRALAALPEVAFVYRQRGPNGHREHRPARRARAESRPDSELVRSVLAGWRDDADDPLDLDGVEIPWNLKRVDADRAWREERATGRGVVVAIHDTGLLPIPPLTQALWRNPRERLDGRDEDGDGRVDDVFGWDFRAESNACLGDEERPHGSMCAGIVAGRPYGEPRTITGVAPRARIMLARGMGYLRALEYVAKHEADIVSLSFMWIGIELGATRGLYRTAYEHLSAAGVLAVGGAGNFGTSAPKGRQIALPKDIPCVLAAAGILQDGRRPPNSSAGPVTWSDVPFFADHPPEAPLAKPDVTGCFGGFPVWSRANFPRARVVAQGPEDTALVVGPQGNSFAGPHAAGIAALVLSVAPDLQAWVVKEILESTCTDLGPEGRDPEYGAGLLQALAAVRAARKRAKT